MNRPCCAAERDTGSVWGALGPAHCLWVWWPRCSTAARAAHRLGRTHGLNAAGSQDGAKSGAAGTRGQGGDRAQRACPARGVEGCWGSSPLSSSLGWEGQASFCERSGRVGALVPCTSCAHSPLCAAADGAEGDGVCPRSLQSAQRRRCPARPPKWLWSVTGFPSGSRRDLRSLPARARESVALQTHVEPGEHNRTRAGRERSPSRPSPARGGRPPCVLGHPSACICISKGTLGTSRVSKAPEKQDVDVGLALFSFPVNGQRFHEPQLSLDLVPSWSPASLEPWPRVPCADVPLPHVTPAVGAASLPGTQTVTRPRCAVGGAETESDVRSRFRTSRLSSEPVGGAGVGKGRPRHPGKTPAGECARVLASGGSQSPQASPRLLWDFCVPERAPPAQVRTSGNLQNGLVTPVLLKFGETGLKVQECSLTLISSVTRRLGLVPPVLEPRPHGALWGTTQAPC